MSPRVTRAKPSESQAEQTVPELIGILKAAGADPVAFGVPSSYAARLAGISQQAIHRAIMRGTLRARRFLPPGRQRASIVVDLESLRAYIERNRR